MEHKCSLVCGVDRCWRYDLDGLVGHVVVLTGCRQGPVRRALAEHGPAAAQAELVQLVDGRPHGRSHPFAPSPGFDTKTGAVSSLPGDRAGPTIGAMSRFRTYWIYSAGLAVAWVIVFALVLTIRGTEAARTVLPVFLGFCIGWVSTTIARYVYPPAKRWRTP